MAGRGREISGRALAAGKIVDGPDGDLFHADVTEVVHTHLDEQAHDARGRVVDARETGCAASSGRNHLPTMLRWPLAAGIGSRWHSGWCCWPRPWASSCSATSRHPVRLGPRPGPAVRRWGAPGARGRPPAGRGWPTISLFAPAYALFEEGPVDQMVFNPGYRPRLFAGYPNPRPGHQRGRSSVEPCAAHRLEHLRADRTGGGVRPDTDRALARAARSGLHGRVFVAGVLLGWAQIDELDFVGSSAQFVVSGAAIVGLIAAGLLVHRPLLTATDGDPPAPALGRPRRVRGHQRLLAEHRAAPGGRGGSVGAGGGLRGGRQLSIGWSCDGHADGGGTAVTAWRWRPAPSRRTRCGSARSGRRSGDRRAARRRRRPGLRSRRACPRRCRLRPAAGGVRTRLRTDC